MAASKVESLQSRLETLIAYARLLERVEASPVAVGADQYLSLVRQLQNVLSAPLPDQARERILHAYPATAEIYENLHYETSGLSRSALDRSVATEMQATGLLHKFALKADGAGR